jgi:hypothetical protein
MRYVDEYVIGNVLERLADPELWARIDATPSDEGAGAELVALEARKRMANDQFADSDTMTPAALEGILRRLDERIAAVQARIASRQTSHVLDGCRDMSREQWDALPMDRRRAIVRATVRVEVLRSRQGRGFDTSSVVVTPVGGEGAGQS